MVNKESLNELVNRAADGAYVVDQEQRIVAWNKAAEKLLGFEAEDVIGTPCYQILCGHADDGCAVCRRGCQPFSAARHGELVPNFDIQVRTTSGHPHWVNVSILSLDVEAKGNEPDNWPTLAVVHLFRDIESKKQAESFASEVAALARHLRPQHASKLTQQKERTLDVELTDREQQVLELLGRGNDTDDIVSELLIGRATVRNHIQRVLAKLGVHSRLEAVALGREHGLIR